MSEPTADPAEVLLKQALAIVTGARRQTYGVPERNLECISDLWRIYLTRRREVLGTDAVAPDATDVAMMMVLMKVARLAETPHHADSLRDIAGYAACGARCSGADLTQ